MQDNLKQYLWQNHAETTAYGYYRNIQIYLEEQSKAETSSYKDIVNYLVQVRSRYHNGNTIKTILNSIKKYYDYLIATGKRDDHPCKNLTIKDKLHKDVQIQDLFSEKELEELMNYQSKRFKTLLETRDKSMLSLLIYQGITKGELKRLSVEDLNLETGKIYIKSTRNSNSRTLNLKNNQIMLFYKYKTEIRPELQKKSQTKTDKLFITTKGKAETGDSLKYIFQQIKQQQGRSVTINQIRQSVIAIQLQKGKDIREVQIFCGHKNASSTERYKAADIEELKAGINKYHPLK